MQKVEGSSPFIRSTKPLEWRVSCARVAGRRRAPTPTNRRSAVVVHRQDDEEKKHNPSTVHEEAKGAEHCQREDENAHLITEEPSSHRAR